MAKAKRVSKEHRERIKTLYLLIAHHQNLASQLEREVGRLLATYGADVAREDWHLNIVTGELNREQPTDTGQ